MKQLLLTTAAIFLTLKGSESFAAKFIFYVQPNGKTFTIEPVDKGMVRFTITRDPAHTKKTSYPELRVVRSAHLTVSDGERDLIVAPVAPRTMRNGHLKYTFKVREAYVPHTSFRISETEEYKGRTGYIGGGEIFVYQTEDPTPSTDDMPNPAEIVKGIFALFDANKNQLLEGSELPAEMKSRMEIADRDRDGTLSMPELADILPTVEVTTEDVYRKASPQKSSDRTNP